MKDQLRASLTDAQNEAAAAIGEDSQLTPTERIAELFVILGDPQLSADDIRELLGGTSTELDIQTALDKLVEDGTLDKDEDTQRPLDGPGIVLYRLTDIQMQRLKIIALEASVGDGTSSSFQFTCDGRIIRSISKVDRLSAIEGTGNQRTEIRKHVETIAEGIESGDQVPNAILLVIDADFTAYDPDPGDEIAESFVVIRPLQEEWIEIPNPIDKLRPSQLVRVVELDIPFRNAAFDIEKPCLLVDGQQRTAALSHVSVQEVPAYSLTVNAVIATDDDSKKIFKIANTTVKIATDFSRALVAAMHEVPAYLVGDKRRANATKSLALVDDTSPFFGLVKYPGAPSSPNQVLVHNSLYQVVSSFDQKLDFDSDEDLAAAVKRAYLVVRDTWPSAWGGKATESKLMHGAGLRSLGELIVFHLRKAVAEGSDLQSDQVWEALRASLERLTPIVQWTAAEAATGTKEVQKNWTVVKDAQVTSKDIAALSDLLTKASVSADAKAQKAATKAS
jgi:DGQHR domain-containing protein